MASDQARTRMHPGGAGAIPEAALLLACARLRPGPETRQRIEQLVATNLDWPLVLKLAARHRLLPLLRLHLNAIVPSVLPRQVFVDLWAHQEELARKNQAMATELLEILALLEARGIPGLPYKGPALAAAVYGDLALREFGDLDILLRPGDLLAAKEALRTLGYAPEFELTPAAEAAFLRSSTQYHLVLFRGRDSMRVELHWKTDPDHPVEEDTAAWWAGQGTAPLGEGRIRCFEPHELLLVLCLHGSKHHWSSLTWLVDVAELLRQQPDLDWDWIFARAADLGATRRLALGLHLAHRLLDAPLLGAVGTRVAATPTVAALAARITASLLEDAPRPLGPLARLRRDLALHEGLRPKAAHALHVLFAPSHAEWVRWPLPKGLFFLYAPLRVGRLVGKHVFRMEPPV